MQLAFEAAQQLWLTVWHVLPWLAGLAVVFTLLSRLSPCNGGKPWWEKRGLLTDLGYWIAVPIFTRYLRIWVTVFLTMWLFDMSDGQQIADFYLNGHGPIATLPLWVQGLIYLVASDFVLYWIHRGFHRGALWKYHAIHHAPKEVEWLSAARFHPVNLVLGTAAVDIAFLLAGISPNIFIVIGPFTIITSCMVHANLNWTFGPLRHVLVSPVFHRWHHSRDMAGRNFASTFALWDVIFGTYYMPKGALPEQYGIDDDAMPEGMWAQTIYPLIQREDGAPRPAVQNAA